MNEANKRDAIIKQYQQRDTKWLQFIISTHHNSFSFKFKFRERARGREGEKKIAKFLRKRKNIKCHIFARVCVPSSSLCSQFYDEPWIFNINNDEKICYYTLHTFHLSQFAKQIILQPANNNNKNFISIQYKDSTYIHLYAYINIVMRCVGCWWRRVVEEWKILEIKKIYSLKMKSLFAAIKL